MLVAIDQNGQTFTAYNKTKEQLEFIRRKKLVCPECKNQVVLKAGQVKVPHFAHLTTVSCPNHQGESDEHLHGKLSLYTWLRQQGIRAVLEHSIPSINQRVDVLFKYQNKWFAFEFQCSPISLAELQHRTFGIASKNIYPIWIFGPRYENSFSYNFRLNTTLKASIHYFPKISQTKLYFFNPHTNQFIILSDLYTSQSSAIGHITRKSVKQMTIKDLFHNEYIPKSFLYQTWSKEKLRFRSSQKKYVSNLDREFLIKLYQHHLHPQFLPSCIHLPVKNTYRYPIPNYIWQTQIILYIHELPFGKVFTWQDIREKCHQYFQTSVESIYPANIIHPAYDYLMLLVRLGYLKRIQRSNFVKTKDFEFYQTLEQAIKGDRKLLGKLLKLKIH